MTFRSAFAVALVSSCPGLMACGGSASETPLPLPPHPLHEPYRVKRISQRQLPPSEPVESPELEGEPAEGPPAATPARSTWGGEAPRRPAPSAPAPK